MKINTVAAKKLSFQNCSESDEDHQSHQKKKASDISWKKQKKQCVRISDSKYQAEKFKSKDKNISGMKKNSTT